MLYNLASLYSLSQMPYNLRPRKCPPKAVLYPASIVLPVIQLRFPRTRYTILDIIASLSPVSWTLLATYSL